MESALRILHIVDSMNYSGIPTLLMNLYRKTDRKKIQFDFLTSRNGAYDSEIKKLGGLVYQVPRLEEIGCLKYTRALRNFFKLHSSYIIVHIGGFTSQKKHGYIIDIFRAFRRGVPHAKLVLIGEGPLKEATAQKLNQYHLKNDVYVLGTVNDVESWLQAFDVFLNPSIQEGLPISILEAECAEPPILVSENIKVDRNLGIKSIPLQMAFCTTQSE